MMTDNDMPANDASRYGGPAGWRIKTALVDCGKALGVAIESYDERGSPRRHAVRIPLSLCVDKAMPALTEWAFRA